MTCFRLIAAAFVLFLIFFPATAANTRQAAPSEFYAVTLEIKDGARVVGRPEFTVRAGEEAFISVDREDGYAVKFAVFNDGQTPGRVRLSSQVYLPGPEGWHRVAAPEFTMPAGRSASVSGPMTSERGMSIFSLKATVEPVAESSLSSRNVSLDDCPGYRAVGGDPIVGATRATLRYSQDSDEVGDGSGPCCSTSCLRCCGTSACCSDNHRCPGGGCCTGG